MPNALAYLMLLIWPMACIMLFRRLPLERAVVWSILGAYLILPPSTEFDLPLVPDLDKFTIPSLCLFFVAVFVLRNPAPRLPKSPVVKVLIFLFLLSVIPTVLTNQEPLPFSVMRNTEPISFEVGSLPGLHWRDIGSVVANQAIILLPFIMAYAYLSTDRGLRELLLALALGGLAYSLPALVEVRLSPQINIWVYGFFQHDFYQMMRDGGFRPLVFLPHALLLAFMFMSSILAALALARVDLNPNDRLRYGLAAIYLVGVLYLCKSLASQLYAVAFAPVVFLAPVKWQIRIALGLAAIAVVYPMLRNLGLVPIDAILESAYAFNTDRGHSLGFRFDNEEKLLARAHEKNWFGWGGWGRNLERHPETGQILTIPDGQWIIVFGTFGWVGYIAQMGLLASPIAMLAHKMRGLNSTDLSPYVAPVAIILVATMVDMLINATLRPFTWLCAGAVLGYAEGLQTAAKKSDKPTMFGEGPVIGSGRGEKKPRTLL